jgi:methylglutamate dehydrogenase subunit D
MADSFLASRDALPFLEPASATGAATICELGRMSLATVLARKGRHDELAKRIRQHFLVELPTRPACAGAAGIAFLGTGPHTWLAIDETGDNPTFVARLKQLTHPFASVVDQSSGYAAFRVGGPRIRAILGKGFAIDLDPRTFRPGDAATTMVSHLGATIWRGEDDPEGFPVYTIVVFRSLALSFWHWFSESAAEFGFARVPPQAH